MLGDLSCMTEIRSSLLGNWEDLTNGWSVQLTDQEKLEFGQVCVAVAATLCWKDRASLVRFFKLLEKSGVHMLPAHFYSPVPILSELDPDIFEKRYSGLPGVTLDRSAHANLLQQLSHYSSEMQRYPEADAGNGSPFFWRNPAFGKKDALIYYSMLRELKPELVVEVGAGYSTLIAVDALEKNGKGSVICVDPRSRHGDAASCPAAQDCDWSCAECAGSL